MTLYEHAVSIQTILPILRYTSCACRSANTLICTSRFYHIPTPVPLRLHHVCLELRFGCRKLPV